LGIALPWNSAADCTATTCQVALLLPHTTPNNGLLKHL
jgi:hypothetical protein